MTEPNCKTCYHSIHVYGAETLRRLITHRGYTDDKMPPHHGGHLVCEQHRKINCKPHYKCDYSRENGSDE